MTQYPNYAAPAVPPANLRPTAVTVLSIIGIVWGVLMLLCNGAGLLPLLIPQGMMANPAFEELRAHPVAGPWSIAGPIIGIVLAVVLLAGSGGALGLKPWGRSLMNLFAAVEIVVALFNGFVTVAIVNPITSKMLANMPANTNAQMFQAGQSVGAIVGILLTIAFPVCILIFMNRPHVKAAFAAGGAAGGPGYPQQAYPGAPGMYPPPQTPGNYPPPQPPGNYPPRGPYSQ